MADINDNAEGRGMAGTLHVKILPDLDGFTDALEKGLRDAEESTSSLTPLLPIIGVLTRMEEHLRVIASAHQPITLDHHEFRNPKKEN